MFRSNKSLSLSLTFVLFVYVCLLSTSFVFAHRNGQFNSKQYVDQKQQQQQQQQPPQPKNPAHQESFLDHADREHIAHDMKDQYYVDIDKDKVPESEMDFYNFKLHDLDNNFLLDGIELLSAINHDNPDKEIDVSFS